MGAGCSQYCNEDLKVNTNYLETEPQERTKHSRMALPGDDKFETIADDLNSTMLKSPETGLQTEIEHLPKGSVAIKVDNPPDRNHHNKKVHLETLEPFQYDADKPEDKHLPKLPAYLVIESKVIYIGQWKNGLRHGRGEQYWPNGSVHEGYWKNDERDGKGRFISEEGDIYEGEWKSDKKHGKGKQIWGGEEGGVYIGQFIEGRRHGQGALEWTDGRKYNGDWRANKMHGKGEFVWPDGRSYKGEYKEDMKDGQGLFEWSNKVKYEGPFVNNKQHGEGKLLLPTGGHKKGTWQEGKLIKWIQGDDAT